MLKLSEVSSTVTCEDSGLLGCRLCDVFHICKDLRKVNKYDMI